MPNLDEFESLFRSADKPRYVIDRVGIQSALVVTDLADELRGTFVDDVRGFLAVLGDDVRWDAVGVGVYGGVEDLLDHIGTSRPDLICTHRNLRGRVGALPYSLGSFVDVLTQATSTPVLLLPNPTEGGHLPASCTSTERVMVLTDNLAGEHRLTNFGVRFTPPAGDLFLAHLEDDVVFARYMEVISKIPVIDTEEATETIREQLLKEPRDYIASCREGLAEAEARLTVHELVEMGHQVSLCNRLIDEHRIDLVVMNTKDEDQLAMHGLAYALAVELRDHPLLLL